MSNYSTPADLPYVTLGSTPGSTFGAHSVGEGLTVLTPSGTPTVTGGFNEACDYLQSKGGGVVEFTSNVTGAGQFVWRSGVQIRPNQFLCTSTSPGTCLDPFITDPEIAMGLGTTAAQSATDPNPGSWYVSANSTDRFDSIINTLGGVSISSPYTYTNSTAYYQFLQVFGGTVSAISVNGIAFSTYAFGVFAVKPGGTVEVTFSAAPFVSLLAGVVTVGSGVNCAYDLHVTGAGHSPAGLMTGWVNSAALSLGNCGPSRGMKFVSTDGCGNGLRLLGAGPANVLAAVNNHFDYVMVKGYGKSGYGVGGTGTPAYGLDFANNVDHNVCDMANLQSDGSGAATNGSACVIFNDGTISASTDNRVNANVIQYLIDACNQTSEYVVASNKAGVSATESENRVNNYDGSTDAVVTPTYIANGGIFTGYDRGAQINWNKSTPVPSAALQSSKYTKNLSSAAYSAGVSQVICGLGSSNNGVPFEPKSSGIINVSVAGSIATATGVALATAQLWYATTPNGSQNGGTTNYTSFSSIKNTRGQAAGDSTNLALIGQFTGSVNTTYYIDLGQATGSTSDAVSISACDILIWESAQ